MSTCTFTMSTISTSMARATRRASPIHTAIAMPGSFTAIPIFQTYTTPTITKLACDVVGRRTPLTRPGQLTARILPQSPRAFGAQLAA